MTLWSRTRLLAGLTCVFGLVWVVRALAAVAAIPPPPPTALRIIAVTRVPGAALPVVRTDVASATFALPGSGALLDVHVPAFPAVHLTGTVIVVILGGSYASFVEFPFAPILAWLIPRGVTVALLKYSLPYGDPRLPMADVANTVQFLRNSRAYLPHLNVKRIGLLGLSAGGHLAALMSTVDDPASRSDFSLLFCPVISMRDKWTEPVTRRNWMGRSPNASQIARFSAEQRVSSSTAPAYLGHAIDDDLVPIANSRAFATALRAHRVPVVLHEMPGGGHALDYCQGARWQAMLDGAWAFLARQHFVE